MKQYEIVNIKLTDIDPNEWNPNTQDNKTFEMLVEELDQDDGVGYIDLIQVVKMGDRYRIIGGEHRWRALMTNGEEYADCIVLTDPKWQDEDLQKSVTMRLNSLKGKIDPEKFIALYEDLAKRHDEKDMQRLFAVSNDAEWKKMVKDLRKDLANSLGDGDKDKKKKAMDKFDKKAKSAQSIEDLAAAIDKIFTEYAASQSEVEMVEKGHELFISTLEATDHVHLTVTEDQFYEVEKFFETINDSVDMVMLECGREPDILDVHTEGKIRAEVIAHVMSEVFKKVVNEGIEHDFYDGVKQLVAPWVLKG